MKKTTLSLALALSLGPAFQTFAQNGLQAEYFTGSRFDRKILTRTDAQINFVWPLGTAPASGIDPENYSVRWTGKLRASETGTYKFSAVIDDGMRVWIGGELIIDAWRLNDDVAFSGKKEMVAGRTYDLKVEYFNGLREGSIILKWLLPSEQSAYFSVLDKEPKPIPAANYSHTPPVSPPVAKPPVRKKEEAKPKPPVRQKPDKPAEVAPVKTEQPAEKTDSLLAFIPKNIQFVKSKSIILPDSYAELDNLVAMLKRHPKLRLRIEGHTDNVGDAALNMELSKQRAMKVANYLVTHGIDAARLRAFGYGSTRPIDTSDTMAGHARNRRVEFLLE